MTKQTCGGYNRVRTQPPLWVKFVQFVPDPNLHFCTIIHNHNRGAAAYTPTGAPAQRLWIMII